MTTEEAQHYNLTNPPEDGITNVVFHPTKQNLLLSSSWDKTIRIHDTVSCQMNTKIDHDTPMLDACFGSGVNIFSAGLDGQVNWIDIVKEEKQKLGSHSKGARSLCWSNNTNMLYSGSWDKSICTWDPRSKHHLTGEYKLSQKVYSMDMKENTLVVAFPHHRLLVYDIRKMDKPRKVRDTALKYMLKTVRLSPDGKAFACSSIEGRVTMDFFDHDNGDKRYAFKLHRQRHGTFASGGSDGTVSIWDGVNQKRIRQFPKYTEEISDVAFNCDGTQLAIARSYTFDEGERPHAPDAIFIRTLGVNDCKPRPD
ncbi:WD40-repeat-containing domain protein [Halteromyces radiatus]|uniref:WD40-repeat-containing domain protein n=1 Tax=Halteromyces radiatus TaxID=101107 RepID=UPI00221E89E4|nr:WD40-repeat-containing domain protein [Halteromyces radiatus]KAI8089963.1 WD40-repeat-containing domain protein [Halteromyces radiatus]